MDKWLLRTDDKASQSNGTGGNTANIDSDQLKSNLKDVSIKRTMAPDGPVSHRKKICSTQTANCGKNGNKKKATLEQHRRRLGDCVKAQISMEKHAIAARCHCKVDIDIDTFKKLVVPNAAEIVPESFTCDTPVISVILRGHEAAGAVFGKTKVRGGNKYETREAHTMQLVFYPLREKMRVWWTMYPNYGSDDDDGYDD